MRNDWILHVLTDLRTFADQNGMLALAVQLDETLIVASTEISASPVPCCDGAGPETADTPARSTH